ncbi:MAG: class I SAM-dependent methyltransferase [Pyrinomonadaceae bacterium]
MRVLSYLERGEVGFQVPLYSLLDWIYNERLVRYTGPVLHGEILDVACGTSYVFRSLIEGGWKGRVSGFDISKAMLAEGTGCINQMLRRAEAPCERRGALHLYRDGLGRDVVDFGPPVNLVDQDSLVYLRDHRQIADAAAGVEGDFSTVTAFSGPLCFFPPAEQMRLLARLLSGARKYTSLQFKNAAFYLMNSSTALVREIAGLIEWLFEKNVVDSYAYLHSVGYKPETALPTLDSSVAVAHEVGCFSHYPVSLDAVLEAADELGFTALRRGSMGFASETFFGLFRRRYAQAATNPARAREFFQIMLGVDEYFCSDLVWGENLHLTLVRRSEASFQEADYRFELPYRLDYVARDDAGEEG